MKISDLLNEAGEPRLKIGDIDPRNGKKILTAVTDSEGYVVRNAYGDIWNVTYGEPDKAPDKTPDVGEITPRPPVNIPPPDIAPTPDEPLPPDVTPDPDPTPPKPTEKCGPEVQAKIKAAKTFKQAYALAKSSECPEFTWCQIVDVPGSAPQPAPTAVPTPSVSNPMGDFDPTMFSGDATSAQYREDIDEAEFRIPESEELHRMREIAGTQVVYEADQIGMMKKTDQTSSGKGIPEIKAPTKEKAIEIARKKGIKRFRFCGQYKVKAAKKGSAPQPVPPKPQPKPTPASPVTTNPMGDVDPTAFSGDFTKPR